MRNGECQVKAAGRGPQELDEAGPGFRGWPPRVLENFSGRHREAARPARLTAAGPGTMMPDTALAVLQCRAQDGGSPSGSDWTLRQPVVISRTD
jgi:hypothetical protein